MFYEKLGLSVLLLHISLSLSGAVPISITLTNPPSWTDPGGTADMSEDYHLGFSIDAEPAVFGLNEFSLTNHVQGFFQNYYIQWYYLADLSGLPGSVSISTQVFREGSEIGGSTSQTNYLELWGVHRRSGYLSTIGSQLGTNNYLGITLYSTDGAPHYGFVQFAFGVSFQSTSVEILGGAVNSDPYAPIVAGVPEPSTYALLAMTAAGALWRARWKK
jgi:hypothetical protein